MAMLRYDSLVEITMSAVRNVMRSSASSSLLAEAALAELGFVEFGIDVVVIEHELLAEQLVEAADEENRVRRIAGVDDVEAAPEQHLQRQPELHDQRHAVFERVAQRAVGLARQRMPMDVDAVDRLETLLVPGRLGADDGHRVTRRGERARLLPDTPVERAWQVLHDDEHARAAHARSLRSGALRGSAFADFARAVTGFGHSILPGG